MKGTHFALYGLFALGACSSVPDDGSTPKNTTTVDTKVQQGGGGGGAFVPVFCELRDGMGGWPMGYCQWNFAERSVDGGVVWQCEAPVGADICQIMDTNIPGGTDEIKWSRPPLDQHWHPGLKLWEAIFGP
jgi:hypothetical protein